KQLDLIISCIKCSSPSRAPHHLKQCFTTSSPSNAQPIDEQTLPRDRQRQYCPIRIGQRLVDRYKIVAKVGFGAYSTVWLARDERQAPTMSADYAAIKILVQDERANSPVTNELNVLRKLKECPSDHFAASVARLPSQFFEVEGPSGRRHHCIAAAPRGCSLWDLQDVFPERRMPHQLVANMVRGLLGYVTSQNVLRDLFNDEPFAIVEREEAAEPSVPVMDGDYPVYPSRRVLRRMSDLVGTPCLTDFGSARRASLAQTDWCMPDTHRAPEVLMGVPWGCQVDVWSNDIMYVLPVAVAQYISVLGPPPMWMVQESRNPHIRALFDDQGKHFMLRSKRRWSCEEPIPEFSLNEWVTAIPKGQDKEEFLRFIHRILVWEGLERATSTDLFAEEWTTSGFR
ncbi:protein kinase, partial [Teratosphaeria destructans]